MLAIEDSDEDRIYFAKGVPRDWVISGQEIRISQAPTRWGRVNFSLVSKAESKSVVARVELARPGAPKEVHVKLRLPVRETLREVRVNGRPASLGGPHNDTVIIQTRDEKIFEVIGLRS